MLVGRAAEQRLIDRLLAGARIGQSGVLVITGEAGIGKSTLLDYAADSAVGVRVLRAAGTPAERDVPFGGLAQLLHPTPADLDRLPAPQAHALGVALAQRTGAAADRFGVGAATLTLLTRLSEEDALVLIVDDAHLLDRSSAEAILFAARRLLADPVVILAAVRAGEPTPLVGAGLPEIDLAGLDVLATRALCERLAAGPITPALPDRLHALTGGNPLAIRELARNPQLVLSLPPNLPVPVPAAVTEWYAARVRLLDEPARRALLLAAVGGGELALIARAGADVSRLDDAEAAGLVVVGVDRVEFTHPLASSAVYATALPAERRALHAAIAAALPAGDDGRAWHRSAAVIGPDAGVAVDLEAVGDRAIARGAAAIAARAFERAAQLSPDPAERAGRLVAAGEAAWAAGDGPAATALLEHVLTEPAAAGLRGRALGVQGEIAVRSGSLVRARDLLLEAAAEFATTDPGAAALNLAEAVYACAYLGDAAGALVVAERAERALAAGAAGRAAVLYALAAGMGRVLAGYSGAEHIRAAVSAAAVAGNPTDGADAGWLVAAPLWLRESGPVRARVRALVDERRARTTVGQLPRLLFHVARDGATTTDWARAEADYAEAIGLGRELGQNTEVAASLAGLAWLLARSGCAEPARARAAEALALAADQHNHMARMWVEFALGELELAEGRTEDAVRALGALAAWQAEVGLLDVDVSPAPELVEALVRGGELARADEVATAFGAAAATKGQPWSVARAERARALVAAATGDLERAWAGFDEALAVHRRTPDAFELARTALVYGEALRRSRRRVDARRQLRAALAGFERLGAQPWADRAAAELEASGETALRSGQDGHLALTPRELQIAVLLADGKTTREAAAALFLSPKTVEYHLSHVYTKLGISSRAALADRLAERS